MTFPRMFEIQKLLMIFHLCCFSLQDHTIRYSDFIIIHPWRVSIDLFFIFSHIHLGDCGNIIWELTSSEILETVMMMINYLFLCPHDGESLKLTGLRVLLARIITIGQLNLLSLGDRAIVYADILLFTDTWFCLKDYSLFWNSWLILVKRLASVLSWW